MTTASTLLHFIALSACLAIQAMPGAAERPSGIRRALQTMDKPSRPAIMASFALPAHDDA